MPRSPGVQEGAQYDHYIHIDVALNSLRGLLERFGCWACMDVRPSTALPVQTSYEEANLALMQLQFNRLGIHDFTCLDGCTAAFRQPEFLQPRQYIVMAQEALPQGVEKFFFHGEGMSYWQQARLQFLWVFALGETGELRLYKIAGHLDDQRQFHPNPRPEHRAITYTALDGAPRSPCKNHYQNSNVTRAETPCLPGWTLVNGVFVDDYGHQREAPDCDRPQHAAPPLGEAQRGLGGAAGGHGPAPRATRSAVIGPAGRSGASRRLETHSDLGPNPSLPGASRRLKTCGAWAQPSFLSGRGQGRHGHGKVWVLCAS